MRGRPPSTDLWIGREEATATCIGRLRTSPGLLTVVGPAGIGKTRLAEVVYRALWTEFPGRAVWCDLSTAKDQRDVITSIATAFGVVGGTRDLSRSLEWIFSRAPAGLIVLDGVDEVLEDLVGVAESWLIGTSAQRILLASREATRLRGEVRIRLGPLRESDGVELFVRAARAAGHAIGTGDAGGVTEWVRAVGGNPLGIRLLAGRAPTILGERPGRHLTTTSRDPDGVSGSALGTLSALTQALDDSIRRLPDPLRDALGALAAFHGDFDAARAAAVLGQDDAVPVIDSLLARSLLAPAEAPDGRRRFRFHALVATRARALTAPAVFAAARLRHAHAYLDLARDVQHRLTRSSASDALEVQRVEARNFRGAYETFHDLGRTREAAALLVDLATGYAELGPLPFLLDALEAVLALPGGAGFQARASAEYSRVLRLHADAERAVAEAERALAFAASEGDLEAEAIARTVLGHHAYQSNRPREAVDHLQKAWNAARAAGRLDIEVYAFVIAGIVELGEGRRTAALDLVDRARNAACGVGSVLAMPTLIALEADLSTSADSIRSRVEGFAEAVALAEALGNKRAAGTLRIPLAAACFEAGDEDRAFSECHNAEDALAALGSSDAGIASWQLATFLSSRPAIRAARAALGRARESSSRKRILLPACECVEAVLLALERDCASARRAIDRGRIEAEQAGLDLREELAIAGAIVSAFELAESGDVTMEQARSVANDVIDISGRFAKQSQWNLKLLGVALLRRLGFAARRGATSLLWVADDASVAESVGEPAAHVPRRPVVRSLLLWLANEHARGNREPLSSSAILERVWPSSAAAAVGPRKHNRLLVAMSRLRASPLLDRSIETTADGYRFLPSLDVRIVSRCPRFVASPALDADPSDGDA